MSEIAPFEAELASIAKSKTASASRIQAATKEAIKHAREYKMIVFAVEKFLSKVSPTHKLSGLYVVDSICRTAKKTHPKLVARFEGRLVEMFSHIVGCAEIDSEKVKRLVSLWAQNQIFPKESIDALYEKYGSFFGANNTSTSSSSQQQQPAISFSMAGLPDPLTAIQQKNEEKKAQAFYAFDYGDDEDIGRKKKDDELEEGFGNHNLPAIAAPIPTIKNDPRQLTGSVQSNINPSFHIDAVFSMPSTHAQYHESAANQHHADASKSGHQTPQYAASPINASPINDIAKSPEEASWRQKMWAMRYRDQDVAIGPEYIRVLTRTTFIPGIKAGTTIGDIVRWVVNYEVDLVTYNAQRGQAFIKFASRNEAQRAMYDINRGRLGVKLFWANGFGHKEFSDVNQGCSLIPLSRLNDAERSYLTYELLGPENQHIGLYGGVVCEEPDTHHRRGTLPNGGEVLFMGIRDGRTIPFSESEQAEYESGGVGETRTTGMPKNWRPPPISQDQPSQRSRPSRFDQTSRFSRDDNRQRRRSRSPY